MAVEILMPALSPTMTEGNLLKWHKKEGDKVKSGEVIAEIETDKAVMEVESADSGVLGKIVVPEKTKSVKVNQLIGVLLGSKDAPDAVDAIVKKYASSGVAQNNAAPNAKESESIVVPAQQVSQPVAQVQPMIQDNASRKKISPLAKRIAQQNNVDIAYINGSGPNGRIVKNDVLQQQGSGIKGRAAQEYNVVEASQMRSIIAKRLVEAKQTIPHFYLNMDCDVADLLKARDAINKRANIVDGKPSYKVSVNDFVIKAVAEAMKRVPSVNSSWVDGAIWSYNNIDVSVAVSVDNGLITPIIQNADQKSIVAISREMKSLAERAKNNALKPHEFQGGGFTISNLGMYGVKEFQAIINPPQSSILAVGTIQEKPVVKNGEIQIGSTMTLSISSDHRVVDGVVAAQFMSELKALIENPIMMFVGNLY